MDAGRRVRVIGSSVADGSLQHGAEHIQPEPTRDGRSAVGGPAEGVADITVGGSHGAEWLRLLEEGLDETVVQEIILWTMLRIIDDKERLDKLLSCPSSLVQRCLTEPAVWQALCTRHWPALSRDVASWCAPAANAGVL